MKLSETTQISEPELFGSQCDLFIGASGYETRAAHLLSRLELSHISGKVAFGFTDRQQSRQREDNDRMFARAGFDIVPMPGDSVQDVRQHIAKRIEAFAGTRMRIIVDYSSMTRSWYAGIIAAIKGTLSKRNIECVFSYSPAEFSEPPDPSPNSFVGPIPGYCSLDVPEKPSALIIGLGYERARAFGLLEYVDPAVAFLFYTDPVFDNRFRDAVLTNNAALFSTIRKEGKDRIFAHPLHDLQRTSNMLVSLYSGLREEYRVILAPLGVKPFSLLCILMAARFGDLDVWRVSPGVKAPPQDRKAFGPLIVLSTMFEAS